MFPVRWTSPEAIQDLKFSWASDVWSFGIVCIEILIDGVLPYLGLSNPVVIEKVIGGTYIHPCPPSCTCSLLHDDMSGLRFA